MKISEMRALLRSICPTDPLMHRWLILKGYMPDGPMYRQPALCRLMTLRIVLSKIQTGLWALTAMALACAECGALIIAINAFGKPMDVEPHYRIIACVLAFLAIPIFLRLSIRFLVNQLQACGGIEYEVRDLDDAQHKARRLKHGLFIEPDDDMPAILAARWLYDAFPDRCPVREWEMESLFRTFGLENPWVTDAPEGPESRDGGRGGDALGLYGEWYDNNDKYDRHDPDEWWKYQ